MKKLIYILLPTIIILAIITAITGSKMSTMDLLDGFSKLNFEKFPMYKLDEAINKVNLNEVWGNVWGNVDSFLDFLEAIWNSIIAIGETIAQLAELIFDVIVFIWDILKWLWNNLTEIIIFVSKYIGVLTE